MIMLNFGYGSDSALSSAEDKAESLHEPILGEPESNNYVLNTTTLYGVIFEQRDKISVRKKKAGYERSTS